MLNASYCYDMYTIFLIACSGSVELVSSLTASLHGQSLSQPSTHQPQTAEFKSIDVTESLPPSSLSNVVNMNQKRRTRRQMSHSTHSLPRQSSRNVYALDKRTSTGSDALPWDGVSGGGSRPKLRRYASIAPCSSTPSLEPRLLVKPSRSGSRNRINRMNSLDSSTHHLSSTTIVELERNFYTLQTKRNGVRREPEGEEGSGGGIEGEEKEEGSMPMWTLSLDSVLREDRSEESGDLEILGTDRSADPIDSEQMVTAIDVGHDGQDSSFA